MKIMSWAAACAVAFACLGAPSVLDRAEVVRAEGEDAAQKDPVLTAWEAYKTAKDAAATKRQEASTEYRKVMSNKEATAEQKAEATTRYREATQAAASSLEEPEKAFLDQFAKANFEQYVEQTELLEAGLMGVAEQMVEKTPAEAVKRYEAVLKYLPDSRAAGAVKARLLPIAILATGDFDAAIKRSNEFVKDLEGATKTRLAIMIGDMTAAKGDVEGALKLYAEAIKGEDEKSGNVRYVNIRTELLGKPAPDFKSDTWFGAEATSLSAMKDKVVIIDFWATWCGPCRVAMPGIDKIYRENKDKGLTAVGLTRVYKNRDGKVQNGYLPATKGQINPVEPVTGLDEKGYVAHIGQFHELSGLGYPFCVGTETDFSNYKVAGIPQIVVVDKQGKVALVVIGSGNDALLEAAVKRMVK